MRGGNGKRRGVESVVAVEGAPECDARIRALASDGFMASSVMEHFEGGGLLGEVMDIDPGQPDSFDGLADLLRGRLPPVV